MTEEVWLYQYDLTNGMARALSLQLIGTQLDAVWHTSVVVFGREYYFGAGISEALPGQSHFGQPHKRLRLGTTQLQRSLFVEFLSQLRAERFSTTSYHILQNNCNHFSEAAAQFLCGASIPQEIIDLPRIALASPLGPMLSQMLSTVTNVSEPLVEDAVVENPVPVCDDDPEETFKKAVQAEYDELMAAGGHTAESASEIAVQRALERGL
jgi:hypothetical protein